MQRTSEEIREHYELEKILSQRLMSSTREERKNLYSELYNELFSRLPNHPQVSRKKDAEWTKKHVDSQLILLKRFLQRDQTFVEIGAGDCSLSLELANIINQVYAVDVSDAISNQRETPKNFQLLLSDGISVPLPANTADIVYSNQLMEHLHPEDAEDQLINIQKVLKKGGKYICITPNKINGPHDVSRHFDKSATGFHLREYPFMELKNLFKKVGFQTVKGIWGVKGIYFSVPVFIIRIIEALLQHSPSSIKKNMYMGLMLTIRIVGVK